MVEERTDGSGPTGVRTPIGPRFEWRAVFGSRWLAKVAFLILFLASVVQLLRFERWARGDGPFVRRPEAVAGLLPIGHFTSFFAWIRGGGWDVLLPAGLVIIIGALILSFVFKRGFCAWVCPVGTIWEAFAALGRRVMGRNVRVWKWLDLFGRSVRYLLAASFMTLLMLVSIEEAVGFRQLPYMWIADLKILHLMAEPGWLVAAGLAAVLSFVFGPVWCRYLCPLGGLYSAVGAASPCAVERDKDTCIHCRRCTKVCHAFVEPEKLERVWAPECDGCMDCVKVCPVDGCLEARAFSRIRIAPWAWPVLAVVLWFIVWGFSVALGQWESKIPPEVFREVINSGLIEQRTRGFFE